MAPPAAAMGYDINLFLGGGGAAYGSHGAAGLHYGGLAQPYGGPSPPRYRRSYPFKPPFFYFH
jgi:hypothetical protein